MAGEGIKSLYYPGNPLVKIADPAFLGLHRQAEADMSFKVIEKVAPDEKVWVVVTVDGTPQVIEYSDLPTELAERREPDGRLQLWAGSIAIHLFELGFIQRLASGEIRLPFHRAIKKVPYVGDDGQVVRPEGPNAVKLSSSSSTHSLWPRDGRWSRRIAPRSSNRSRTRPAPTRPRPSASG